ncbi:MAG: peroxidase-related enzyme [Chitinophagaceae bacterium]
MSWIKIISPEDATGKLKEIYNRVSTPDSRVDNILQVHSLRPHTLEGHMKLYKNVLHHSSNTLPKWFLETTGIYVSLLNKCDYCVEHHFAGLQKLLNDDHKSSDIRTSLEADMPANTFSGKELLLLQYAKKLTLSPSSIQKKDIALMQKNNIEDGEILEVNQVTAYFCYANRTVLGLGTSIKGDVPGLSPCNSDNADDWSHT